MTKRIITALVVFVMLFASVPVFAEDNLESSSPAIKAAVSRGTLFKEAHTVTSERCLTRQHQQKVQLFEETLTVTSERRTYRVGFVTIRFPNDFIAEEELPVTVKVSLYAEDGQVWIEFSPNLDEFDHKVIVIVDNYEGLLYDVTSEHNVWVSVDRQVLVLSHFSRYAFS